MKPAARLRKRFALSIAVAVTVATWLTWRSMALGAEIASLQRQLADHLRATPAASTDPSQRVAMIVQADEHLLDRAITLASARHTLLWATGLLWLLALGLIWRWWYTRDKPLAQREPDDSESIVGLSDRR